MSVITVRQLNRETYKVLDLVDREGRVVISRNGKERYELTCHNSDDMPVEDMSKKVGDMSGLATATEVKMSPGVVEKLKEGSKKNEEEIVEKLNTFVSNAQKKKDIKLCSHGYPLGLCKKGCK